MNSTETKMVIVLKELKQKHHASGVKAEFEAEGTRTEELMRLKEICLASGASLTLKIGGCEAVRDMYDARAIGVDYLVAPMVETAFSLRKYLQALDSVFPEDEQKNVEFLVNIETLQAVKNIDKMLEIPEIKKLDGIVIGRVDLTGSIGLDRKSVNSDQIFELTTQVLKKAKGKGMVCVVGGAIAVDTIPFLRKIPAGIIDRYETRKMCFLAGPALKEGTESGISKAVEFELLWLENKRDYYKSISEEDNKRIAMLEERFKKSKS